jgi:predicted phosphohydrolase
LALFALADLHLGFGANKPMDVFGPDWADHAERIAANWRRVVGENDTVLIPGDISWAMKPAGAAPDLKFVGALPGRKILVRGNHDYWWDTIAKVRAALPVGMAALQNDHLLVEGWAICGTRGWNIPGSGQLGPDDPKHFVRERQRLELSLASAPTDAAKIAMLHFPPALVGNDELGFTDILERFGVALCVYGHLHGASDHRLGVQGELRGVRYVLCAADAVDFTPVQLHPPSHSL